jgi:hypothetical protein
MKGRVFAYMSVTRKAPKMRAPAKARTPQGRNSRKPVSEGPPEDELEGREWPSDWIKRVYKRSNSRRKDSYWHTPINRYKLRSMKEVKRFLAALEGTNGDEKQAMQNMRDPNSSISTT